MDCFWYRSTRLIPEHKYSAIGKHFLEAHGDKNLLNEDNLCVL